MLSTATSVVSGGESGRGVACQGWYITARATSRLTTRNWASRETGRSSSELKNRARSRGTLWEPGELAFQQGLQQSDPAEFKALLERNGMQYDPNYRRGTG